MVGGGWGLEVRIWWLRYQGAVKGVLSKGGFLRKTDFSTGKWIGSTGKLIAHCGGPLATPSALESQSRAEQGSVAANPICKCRRHKAGHLQVRVAVGR